MTGSEVLAWLEGRGSQILIQQIPAARRQKNRVLLQYRTHTGEVEAVGGVTIQDAVRKARVRANEVKLGGKEIKCKVI
jgi:hypothetical protein